MLKAIKNNLLAANFVLFCLTSCNLGGGNRLPKSIGQPYEVIVEGDTDSIITQILTEEVPYLPQPEPLCKVIHVKRGKVSGSFSLMRTRIIVDVDARNRKFSIKERRDLNASPQLVLLIKAQNTEQLKGAKVHQALRSAIDQAEQKHLASLIKQNPEMQKEVKKLFGIDMKIPGDMESSKHGKDFLWISNNASTGMQNLLFIHLRGFSQDVSPSPNHLRFKVDSVLKVNLPGETDEMYMQLASISESKSANILSSRQENLVNYKLAGLWEMKGDAMGGPYYIRLLSAKDLSSKPQSWDNSDALVVMGFVYAPEMKKKILIKQLEAATSTIFFK